MTTIISGSKSAVWKQRGRAESECGLCVRAVRVGRAYVQKDSVVCVLARVPRRVQKVSVQWAHCVCVLRVCGPCVGLSACLCTLGLRALWVDAVWTACMWVDPRVLLFVRWLKRGCVDCCRQMFLPKASFPEGV